MTAREVFEGILIELNSVNAPAIFIDEFNYIINKAITQYSNKRYNLYDLNQQTADDLQVLKSTTSISGSSIKNVGITQTTANGTELTEAKYNVLLPADYFHLLNCIVTYTLQKDFKCYKKGTILRAATKRLTSDMYASILNNAWLRPQFKNPYHMIQSNQNMVLGDWSASTTDDLDTIADLVLDQAGDTRVHNSYYDVNSDGSINGTDYFIGPTMLIDYGMDISVFALTKVDINYLRTPGLIVLTPDHLDMTEDQSQLMEFPEYVCREIIKEAVQLLMLKTGDPSLQNHMVVNQSIPGAANQPSN